MKDTIKAGTTVTREFVVDAPRTIDFLGDELRVYATPSLVMDAEITCRDLLLEHADDGEDSVGTGISITHAAATPLGMTVSITATVVNVEGARVDFEVVAHDGIDEVGKGKHSRFAVPVAALEKRIRAKKAAAEEG